MTVRLNPYLNFKNETKAAMEFYHSVFGGELTSNTFAEFNAPVDESESGLIMHSQLIGDNGLVLMAADVPSHMEYVTPAGFSVSLSGDDDATLRGYWEKLIDGGTVLEPLTLAPWGDAFGMAIDKFGITWLVNISGAPS